MGWETVTRLLTSVVGDEGWVDSTREQALNVLVIIFKPECGVGDGRQGCGR